MQFGYLDAIVRPISVSAADWPARVAVSFAWIEAIPVDRKRALVEALREIPGLDAVRDNVVASGFAKRPTLQIDVLRSTGAFGILMHAFDSALRAQIVPAADE